jgi:hypothetical protein
MHYAKLHGVFFLWGYSTCLLTVALILRVLAQVESRASAPLHRRPCTAHFFVGPNAQGVQRLCDLGSRADAAAWGARVVALRGVAELLRACGPGVPLLPQPSVHLPLCHLLRATAKVRTREHLSPFRKHARKR